jgi:hypothetical protein
MEVVMQDVMEFEVVDVEALQMLPGEEAVGLSTPDAQCTYTCGYTCGVTDVPPSS